MAEELKIRVFRGPELVLTDPDRFMLKKISFLTVAGTGIS